MKKEIDKMGDSLDKVNSSLDNILKNTEKIDQLPSIENIQQMLNDILDNR